MASSLPPAPKKLVQVLVVDDNPTNRLLLQRVVEAFGGQACTADDGQQALDRIAEQTFDMVFMDIAMPVMDGMAATKQARANGLETQIVAVTAHYGAGDMPELTEAGFDGLITKPFDVGAVFQRLEQVTSH